MSADAHCDVAIVGGGAIGSAIAYFLTLTAPQISVVVIEPDPTYARASTTLAAGGIRQQFSTAENILMSQFAHGFLQGLSAAEDAAGRGVGPGVLPAPYLRLAEAAQVDDLRQDYELQQRLGAPTVWLQRSDLAARFPWMALRDVAAALIGGAGEGMFDPYAMLQILRREAIARGAVYRRASATGFVLNDDRIAAVTLDDGSALACETVVNAAGPKAARVAGFAGVALPVIGIKAHTFAFRPERPVDSCPIILDKIQGMNLKPEGPLYVCAAPRGEQMVDAGDDFDVSPDLFQDVVWPMLAARVPQFDTLKLVRGWVGHIEWCEWDGNPIIGPHPDIANLIFANGFSGHGVQHAPAVGRGVAEWITSGGYEAIDLGRFGYGRMAEGKRLEETA